MITLDNPTCIIYCRVSSSDQVDGTSLESQERLCREYAERQGWSVLAVFIERGESAKTADRTELNSALAFCKQHRVGNFLVYKLDRFARNQYDHVTVRAFLRRSGTELRSVTEPIDNSPTGRMMEGIISIFAQFDNDVRAERTKQGMIERVKQGVWVWIEPVGYYRPEGATNIVPHPQLAPLVRLGFEKYATGTYNLRDVADLLASRGFRSARGKRPTPELITTILKNPLYRGIIAVWDQEFAGTFEPIVSQELFAKCQEVSQRRSRQQIPPAANHPLFPLRRLVICKVCRQPLTGSSPRGRNGKRYPYYHHDSRHGCPLARSIPKAQLEARFLSYLESISLPPGQLKLYQAMLIDSGERHRQQAAQRSGPILREVARLEAERQQVYQLHRQGVYNNEEMREQVRLVNEQIKAKHALLREVGVSEGRNVSDLLNACGGIYAQPAIFWHKLEHCPASRLRLLKLVFETPVEYDGRRFGNTTLSPIYGTNRPQNVKKFDVVDYVESNWNRILDALTAWAAFASELRALDGFDFDAFSSPEIKAA